MKKTGILFWIAAFFSVFFTLAADDALQPFVWKWNFNGQKVFNVVLDVPSDYHLYADQTSVEVRSVSKKLLTPSAKPRILVENDPDVGKIAVYVSNTNRWTYDVVPDDFPLSVHFAWQGCSVSKNGKPGQCLFPEEKNVSVMFQKGFSSGILYGKESPSKINSSAKTADPFPEFIIERSAYGYHSSSAFTAFLKGEKNGGFFSFEGKGITVILLLTLLGGAALNFTPCVLPMIPINLAIIGAGKKAESRASAVIRGSVYACGIAIAYGIAGVVVVLGGASFGQLDSYWIFNGIVSIIFLLLGLSLFDVFNIDFSRFGSNIATPSTAKLAGVFLLGVISALLAGACVAPVVIAVLLQAARTYAEGNPAGLLLPFVLGIGMGLPWPVISLGIVAVPKPGAWMKYVKYTFGTVIVMIGLYYAFLAGKLLFSEGGVHSAHGGAVMTISDALAESAKTRKSVLIDFRADWCKNCLAMEAGTLKNSEVKKELEKFIFVPFDATKISSPEVKKTLELFGVTGLPTYLIVKAK